MTAVAIPNSLLRVDGTKGEPPAPFEHPNKKMDFFVLELGEHQNVQSWCACVMEAIRLYREMLGRLSQDGAAVTLFVECGSSLPVLRLEAPFLTMLSEADISLECCYDRNA